MQWIVALLPLLIALLSLAVAAIALWNSRAVRKSCNAISASHAKLYGEISQWGATQRSTASVLAELADVRDGIDKGNALLKRIASRETMRDRRNGADTTSTIDGPMTKDDLRRRAGLIAGKPAPHT